MFTLVECDLNQELPELPKLARIFHCASPASPPEYQKFPIETLLPRAEGTRRLLDRAVADGARFLFTSTSEVYGYLLNHPQREDYRGHVSSTGPRSMYDEVKTLCRGADHRLCRAVRDRNAHRAHLQYLWTAYGATLDGVVVSNFIVQAIKGEPLTMYGSGQQTRSFQYIDDLIEGITRLMNSDYSGPVNIGNPNEFTMIELATKVLAMTGSSSEIQFLPLPEDDPNRRRPEHPSCWQKRCSVGNQRCHWTRGWKRRSRTTGRRSLESNRQPAVNRQRRLDRRPLSRLTKRSAPSRSGFFAWFRLATCLLVTRVTVLHVKRIGANAPPDRPRFGSNPAHRAPSR